MEEDNFPMPEPYFESYSDHSFSRPPTPEIEDQASSKEEYKTIDISHLVCTCEEDYVKPDKGN